MRPLRALERTIWRERKLRNGIRRNAAEVERGRVDDYDGTSGAMRDAAGEGATVVGRREPGDREI